MSDYELEKLYINTFAVIGIIVIAAIQFGIIYKFGLKGGIIFALAFSFLFTLGRQVLLSYARGMGDSKGTGPSHEFEIFSSQLLICLILFTVYSLGMYFYIAYLKTGVLNKPVFFPWLVICVGVPVLFFSIKLIRSQLTEADHKQNYINAQFQIFHYNELPIFIEALKVKNSANGKEAKITILNQSQHHSQAFLNRLNVWDKNRYRNPDVYAREFIPLNSDQLYLSWYSPVEDIYYQDVLNFPFSEFSINEEADGEMILNIQLDVFQKGNVYLYTKDGKRHTHQFKTKVLSKKEKTSLVELMKLYNYGIENIEESRKRMEARIEEEESLFQLSYNISGPGDLNSIHFDDRRYWGYDSTYSTLNTLSLKPIPYNITLNFTNTGKENFIRTTIFFDKENLYKTIKSLTNGIKEMPVEILISIKGIEKEAFKVLVKGNNKSVVFSDWERHIETED